MAEAEESIYRYYSTVTRLDYGDNGSNVISFYDNSGTSMGAEIILDTGVMPEKCDFHVTDAVTMFVHGADIASVAILGFTCPTCPFNPSIKSEVPPEKKCRAVYVKKPNHIIAN